MGRVLLHMMIILKGACGERVRERGGRSHADDKSFFYVSRRKEVKYRVALLTRHLLFS